MRSALGQPQLFEIYFNMVAERNPSEPAVPFPPEADELLAFNSINYFSRGINEVKCHLIGEQNTPDTSLLHFLIPKDIKMGAEKTSLRSEEKKLLIGIWYF
jgi:hypothetical protein